MRISDWSSDVCSSDLIEVGARQHEGAARFRHLGAVHGEVAVDVQRRWRPQAGTVQHRRTEQDVEVDDVLAEEKVHIGAAVGSQELLEIEAVARAQLLAEDRKSVVAGKSVTVRVYLGGRRMIKK